MRREGNPIVLANTSWPVPDWLIKQIDAERMIISFSSHLKPERFKDEADYVGDAECLAYLMPATHEAPMQHDWTEIYLYLGTRVMKNYRNMDVPEDIRVTELTNEQERDLRYLKGCIFRRRGGKVSDPVLDAFDKVFGVRSRKTMKEVI